MTEEESLEPQGEPRAGGERASFIQLFGPVQNDGSHIQTVGGTWQHPGAATSTSYKKFWFNRAWRNITWAALKVEWIPMTRGNSLRLIHADDGIANVTTIVEVAGVDNRNPVASAANVTAAFQQLARAGVPKNIGWQVRGDGRNSLRVYQVSLEILEA